MNEGVEEGSMKAKSKVEQSAIIANVAIVNMLAK